MLGRRGINIANTGLVEKPLNFDQAVRLTGNDEWGEVQNVAGLNIAPPYSFSFWYKFDQEMSGFPGILMANRDEGGANPVNLIDLNDISSVEPDHNITLWLENVTRISIPINGYTLGDLIHIIITVDSSHTFKGYKNGVLMDTINRSIRTEHNWDVITNGSMFFGRDGTSRQVKGIFDEFFMINEFIDENAASYIYNNGQGNDYISQIDSSNVIFYWKFNGLQNTNEIYDHSPNSRHIKFNNTIPSLVNW